MEAEAKKVKINLKELSKQEERLAPGHRMCAGCSEPIVVRQVLHAIQDPVVIVSPTGCLQVTTGVFPYTPWRVPWVHSAFENAAATISGIETAYRSMIKQGKIKDRGIKFVVFAGDGATYDIGFQWMSGALERGHKFLYVCLNNEAYMNTGIQRSGATPRATWTTTSPVGKAMIGKSQLHKDVTAIVASHRIPYVAQIAPHAWRDLMTKVHKAISADGPSFLNAIIPCTRGWRYMPDQTLNLSKLAVETCVWPLYEIDHGVWRLNVKPNPKKPLIEWFKSQGRFAHLLAPENAELVDHLQREIDQEWAKLEKLCQCFGDEAAP